MTVKIHLSLTLEEHNIIVAPGQAYKCVIIAEANELKEEFVFNNPIDALEKGRLLAFSWVSTFVNLKRNTRKKLKKQQQMKRPKLVIP